MQQQQQQQRPFPAFQGSSFAPHLYYPRIPALYPHHRPARQPPASYYPLPAYHPYATAPRAFLPPFPQSESQDEFLPHNRDEAPIHPHFYYAPDDEVFYYAPPHDDDAGYYVHGPASAPRLKFLPSAPQYSRRPLAHHPMVWMPPDPQGTDQQDPPEYVYANNPTRGPRRIARPALVPVKHAPASDFQTSSCNCGHQKPLSQFLRAADDSDSNDNIPAGALPAWHRNGVPILLVPTPHEKRSRDKESKTENPDSQQMGACDLPRKPTVRPATREIPVIPAVNESANPTPAVMFTLDDGSQNKSHAVGNRQAESKRPLETQSQVSAGKPVKKMPPAKTSFNEETAAVFIQSLFRGYLVRRSEPLRHLGALSKVHVKVLEFRAQMSDPDVVAKLREDKTERARFAESIMALLLQLDAIQGAHPFVRDRRKAVAKELILMQDNLDSLDLGSSLSVSPKINTNGQDVLPLIEHHPGHKEDACFTNAPSTNANEVAESYSGDSTVLSEMLVNAAADNLAEPIADTQCSPVRSQSAMESETQVSLSPASRDGVAKAAERNGKGLVESSEAPFCEVCADESAVNSSFQLDTTVNGPESPVPPANDIDQSSKVTVSFNEDRIIDNLEEQQEEDRNQDVMQQGMYTADLTSKPCKCTDDLTSKQPNEDVLQQGICSDDHASKQPNCEEKLKMGLTTHSGGGALAAQHPMEICLETKVEHGSSPRNLSTPPPPSNGGWEKNSEEESGLETEQNQDIQCSKECENKPKHHDVQADVVEQVKEMNLEQEEAAAMAEPQVNGTTRDSELTGQEDVKDTEQIITWQQLVQENMRLNLLVEKLVESSHGQAAAILQLNERVGLLEQSIVRGKVCRKASRMKSCNGRRRK